MLRNLVKPKSHVIEIDCTPKRLQFVRDGEPSTIEYSAIEIYFQIQMSQQWPDEVLERLASYLEDLGVVGCTPELAEQIYQLNCHQMATIIAGETNQ